jgi:hypothetical protein
VTEWYVYLEGASPVEVILGRRPALDRLTHNFRITDTERKRLGRLMETMPSLGEPILLVGYNGRPDRRIVRVTGPGTEV